MANLTKQQNTPHGSGADAAHQSVISSDGSPGASHGAPLTSNLSSRIEKYLADHEETSSITCASHELLREAAIALSGDQFAAETRATRKWKSFTEELPPDNGRPIWWRRASGVTHLVKSSDFSRQDDGWWIEPEAPPFTQETSAPQHKPASFSTCVTDCPACAHYSAQNGPVNGEKT